MMLQLDYAIRSFLPLSLALFIALPFISPKYLNGLPISRRERATITVKIAMISRARSGRLHGHVRLPWSYDVK